MVGEPDPRDSQGMQIKRAVISSRANPNRSFLFFIPLAQSPCLRFANRIHYPGPWSLMERAGAEVGFCVRDPFLQLNPLPEM